ncbi:hypothetical protein SKAU_G00074630 [Synaphobranchus kaupii]|uniref:Uncharacterized protein n=1 Tax=Synaphobranchus kaupii TaxID=118154 RepID=A0A9Q1G7E3_SYNKA|nr:hypothetical protein SKAU_G00074630 [Synaphobranchus kaupii]
MTEHRSVTPADGAPMRGSRQTVMTNGAGPMADMQAPPMGRPRQEWSGRLLSELLADTEQMSPSGTAEGWWGGYGRGAGEVDVKAEDSGYTMGPKSICSHPPPRRGASYTVSLSIRDAASCRCAPVPFSNPSSPAPRGPSQYFYWNTLRPSKAPEIRGILGSFSSAGDDKTPTIRYEVTGVREEPRTARGGRHFPPAGSQQHRLMGKWDPLPASSQGFRVRAGEKAEPSGSVRGVRSKGHAEEGRAAGWPMAGAAS